MFRLWFTHDEKGLSHRLPLANFPRLTLREQEELAYAYHKELCDFRAVQWGSDEEDDGEDVPNEPLVPTNPAST